MDTKGGRITLDLNGRRFSARGEATIKPARATPANGVNWDGTAYSSVAPQLATIDMEFDRGSGLTWAEDMMLQSFNATFEETDAGYVHYFTDAKWNGDPSINSKDGSVSGLSIQSDKYRVARTR